jgi:YVTN family beta-propeller protein
MNFSIPGLQNPIDPEKNNVRVSSDDFGNVKFKVLGPLSENKPFPNLEVIITNSSATVTFEEVFRATDTSNIIREPNENVSGHYDFYFVSRIKDDGALPVGNYRVRVYQDRLFIKELWLTVEDSGRVGEIAAEDQLFDDLAELGKEQGLNIDYGFKRFGSGILIGLDVNTLRAQITVEDHTGEFYSLYQPAFGVGTESYISKQTAYDGAIDIIVDTSAELIRDRLISSDPVIGVDTDLERITRNIGLGDEITVGIKINSTLIQIEGVGPVEEFLTGSSNIQVSSTSEIADLRVFMASHTTYVQFLTINREGTFIAQKPPQIPFTSDIDIDVDAFADELVDTTVFLGSDTSDPDGGGTADIFVDTEADLIRGRILFANETIFVDIDESILTREIQFFDDPVIYVDTDLTHMNFEFALEGESFIEVDPDTLIDKIPYIFPTVDVEPSLTIEATAEITTIITNIDVGDTPVGIAYNSTDEDFLVVNRLDSTVDRIDIDSTTNLGDVSIGTPATSSPAKPTWISNQNKYYVPDRDANTVIPVSNTIGVGASIAVGDFPEYGAYGPNAGDSSEDVYAVACVGDDTIYFINTVTNTVITSAVATGNGPGEVAYNSAEQRFAVVNTLDNTVSVYFDDAGTWKKLGGDISVGASPESIRYFAAINKYVVTNRQGGTVTIINGSSNAVEATISTGLLPSGSAFAPDLNMIAVSNAGAQTVTLIDASTLTKIKSISAGYRPEDILYVDYNSTFFTRNELDDNMTVIDAVAQTRLKNFSIGQRPIDFVYSSSTYKIGVVHQNGDNMSIVDARYVCEE